MDSFGLMRRLTARGLERPDQLDRARELLGVKPAPRAAPGNRYWRDLLGRLQARVARSRPRLVAGRDLGDVVDIGRLVCPLRYDLCVRIDFIRLLSEAWSLYETNLAEFLDRPESKAYYVWFKDVACARFRPQLSRDTRRLAPVFVERVHETARLWRSIQTDGYNPATPIRLRAGHPVCPVNGKVINTAYFAGDGCHRMACLFVAGQTQLLPEQYEVLIQPNFLPLDNTTLLIRHLPLDRAGYLRFISGFYCDGRELDTPEAILSQVAASRPDLLAELETVFAFDLPSFSGQ
jgi:hypothetical protein